MTKTSMQVAMEEALSKKYGGMVKSLVEALKPLWVALRKFGEQVARAFTQISESIQSLTAKPRPRPAFPGTLSFEKHGLGWASPSLSPRSR